MDCKTCKYLICKRNCWKRKTWKNFRFDIRNDFCFNFYVIWVYNLFSFHRSEFFLFVPKIVFFFFFLKISLDFLFLFSYFRSRRLIRVDDFSIFIPMIRYFRCLFNFFGFLEKILNFIHFGLQSPFSHILSLIYDFMILLCL